MSVTDPHIMSEKRGALGLLTLDRPKALNALTHGMIAAMAASLKAWAADDSVKAVAIRGEGDAPSVPAATSAPCSRRSWRAATKARACCATNIA